MTNTTCGKNSSGNSSITKKKEKKEKGITENNWTGLETSATMTTTMVMAHEQTRTGASTQSTRLPPPPRSQPLLLPDKPRERVVLSGMGAVTRKVEQIHVCREGEGEDRDEAKCDRSGDGSGNANTKEEENRKGGTANSSGSSGGGGGGGMVMVKVLVGMYVAKAAVFMCKGTVNTKRLFVQGDVVEVLCPQCTATQEVDTDTNTDTGTDLDGTDGTTETATATDITAPSNTVGSEKKARRRRRKKRKRKRKVSGGMEMKVAIVVKKAETGKAKMYCRQVGEILPALEYRGDIWKVFGSKKTGRIRAGDCEHLCLCVEPVDGCEVWIEEKLVYSTVEEASCEGCYSAVNSDRNGKERSGLDEAATEHKQQHREQERSQLEVEEGEEADGNVNNRNSERIIEDRRHLDKCSSTFCCWKGGGEEEENAYENTPATTNTERSEAMDGCFDVYDHESVWKHDGWWSREPSEESWASTPSESKELSSEWMNTPTPTIPTITAGAAAAVMMPMLVRREEEGTKVLGTERRRGRSNNINKDKDNNSRESLDQPDTHFCWHPNYSNCNGNDNNSDNCLHQNYGNNGNNKLM